ncbi:MAG TPA: hypothetical protein VN680_16805 [Burkholderiaceae bacterium]|jgi:hypothetical protein|nr:hypothetical protein [Burkholderiaceae bacterium]
MNAMTDLKKLADDEVERPRYETPSITVMADEEVLKAFQMTALEISAAGCWWSASSWTAGS